MLSSEIENKGRMKATEAVHLSLFLLRCLKHWDGRCVRGFAVSWLKDRYPETFILLLLPKGHSVIFRLLL